MVRFAIYFRLSRRTGRISGQLLSFVWLNPDCVNREGGVYIADLSERNIRNDEVVLIDRFDAKAEVIAEHGVMLCADEQPDMLKHIPVSRTK